MAALTGVTVWVFDAVGIVAPMLSAALIVAAALALAGVGPSHPPNVLKNVAQGIISVSIGLSVKPEIITSLSGQWIPVLAVAVSTLVLSFLAGIGLSCSKFVDHVTGVLSLTAGGSSGLVAAADELGADTRIVVFIQYLRVSIVVITMPLIVTFIFSAEDAPVSNSNQLSSPWWLGFTVTMIIVVVGYRLARLVRFPLPATLGPLCIAICISLSGWLPDISIPEFMLPLSFVIIGWQAGLSFTREGLHSLRKVFLRALTLIMALAFLCACLGTLLSIWTGQSFLQGYLATTPGGIAAVLAVASSTDTDSAFVAASQIIRLVLMVVMAPTLVGFVQLRRRRRQIFFEKQCRSHGPHEAALQP
ncbi:AbrB family transcriptional regulator [Rhodococcus cerastii]|nr:AbrB family transcriptional regulator [Rhodococcus cerastii]